MDYRISGELTFADELHLEQGLDAFFATDPDEHFVDLGAIRRTGLAISIDFWEEGHRGLEEPVTRKLAALARLAERGSLTCNGTVIPAGNAPADPSRPRSYRWDVYYAASAGGDVARLRELVELGASLDGRYARTQATLLHEAARRDTADAVDVLIAAGVDVNAVTTYGGTPLWCSCRLAVTRALLAAGADPNASTDFTSVLLSSITSPDGVTEALLAAGAIPRPKEYVKLAETCAALKKVHLLRELVARAPAMVEALASPQVVAGAISGRDPVTLDYLLEHGAVLPDDFLAQAIRWSATELVEAALRDPDALVKCGPSNHPDDAMCHAARTGGCLDIVKLLARRGVPLHPATPGKTRPFLEAARGGRTETLAWLLEQGVPYDEDAGLYASSPAALMFFVERGFDPDDAWVVMEDWVPAERSEFHRLLAAHRGQVDRPR